MLQRRRPFCDRWHPQLGPTALFLLHWAAQALCCISSAPRQVGYRGGGGFGGGQPGGFGGGGGGGRQVIVNGPGYVEGQGAARAAPNLALDPIGTGGGEQLNSQSAHALLGNRVGIREFGSDGYNAQGGGPVPEGGDLNCDFEGQPCCWANVPTPSDDQLDWQLVQGKPDSAQFRNISMEDRYLVAYANGAAPSDEAQLSSCAIACASSPIRVRARHWQSYNVLLQVCQRESFPTSLGYNPLLNCQEFPSSSQVAHTELVLPKASYVDIVFVASNFIDERGDIVFLDDIKVLYESDPPECGGGTMNTLSYSGASSSPKPVKLGKGRKPKGGGGGSAIRGNAVREEEPETEGQEEVRRNEASAGRSASASAGRISTSALTAGTGAAGTGVAGGKAASAAIDGTAGSSAGTAELAGVEGESAVGASGQEGQIGTGEAAHSKAHGVAGKSGSGSIGTDKASSSSSSVKETLMSISRASSSRSKAESFKATITKTSLNSNSASSSASSASSAASSAASAASSAASIGSALACPTLKCSFESGNSCSYLDTAEPESVVRGLTTRFEVVKGQFMNRVTGVKEGTEGNFYAAVFLYPREKAGLWADVGGQLAEDTRLRFQYYEGTHGVQLKGCCASSSGKDGREELACPFQSDKFVSVTDRMWKWGTFVCPEGTKKVVFLCENTRTNQGACAMDDIAVVENREGVSMQDKPIC